MWASKPTVAKGTAIVMQAIAELVYVTIKMLGLKVLDIRIDALSCLNVFG